MFQSCGRNQSEKAPSLRVKLFRLFTSERKEFGDSTQKLRSTAKIFTATYEKNGATSIGKFEK